LIHSQYAYFSGYIFFYDLSTDDYNEFKLKLFVIFATRVMYEAFTVIGDACNSIIILFNNNQVILLSDESHKDIKNLGLRDDLLMRIYRFKLSFDKENCYLIFIFHFLFWTMKPTSFID
jgi:hypothetical protein